MNTAVGGTGAASNYGQRLRRQAVNPLIRGNWLTGRRVSSQGRPVALAFDLFVGDRPFHYQNKRIQLSFLGLVPVAQEVGAIFVGEYRVMQVYLWEPGNRSQQDVFDTGL